MHAVGLKTSIWNNNLRSMIMIALYPLIITVMTWCIAALASGIQIYSTGYYDYLADYSADEAEYDVDYEEDEDGNVWATWNSGGASALDPYEPDWEEIKTGSISSASEFVQAYWPVIFSVVGCWFLIAAFFHTRMIRMLSHAHPITRAQEPDLYNLLENLCIARGLPVPRLEIIETDARNAFASGIDTQSYTITVTRGLMKSLQKDELEAVLAHELTHIQNNDVRLLIVSLIFTGMIGFICQLYWSVIRHSMYGRGKKDMRLVMILLAIGFILGAGYAITTLTRFAISRRREFMADAGAVELTKNPDALMRALLRISGADRIPDATQNIAMMCIENTQSFLGVFSTHPPMQARLRAISEATQTPVPEIEAGGAAAHGFDGPPKSPWG